MMKLITYNKGKGLFWIRFTFLGNRGFYIKDTGKLRLTFSERNTNKSGFYVRNFYFCFLSGY